MSRGPVAVTGLGCICSIGADVQACTQGLFRERPQPLPPRGFKSGHQTACPVFEVSVDLPIAKVCAPHGLSRTSALALAAATEAWADAGFDVIPPGLRVGVCIGTTVGSALNSTQFYAEYLDGADPDMDPVRRFLTNNPAFVIAREYRFSGPCQTIVNACSSGTDAIGLGAMWIRSGICDVVIAGGADELSLVTYNGFMALMVTDDSPCKPFDRDRKGLNLGEGAAVLVLESERIREMRQRPARGFVAGYGSACDAYHLTAPKPDGAGLRKAITSALEASGATPGEIAFVNAHGTGTADNDRVEAVLLHQILPGVPFFSTKGYTGHTLGAAGAIEAVFTLISLRERRIPASAGFQVADPEMPAGPVMHAQNIGGNIAFSESLAFGGHNSVLILEGSRD